MIDSRHWATLTRNAHRWSRQARMSAYRRLLGALLGDMAPTVKPYGFPTVTFPERIRIGAGTTINYGVVLGGRGGIDIGRRVKLSSRCVLETQFVDPFSGGKSHHEARPIIVEDDVDVGVGALILAGVRVGKRSVIGAGSVVLSDVPADSLAIGVPATVVPLRMASHDAMPSQRPRQPVDEEQIMRRIVRWVREVVDVEVHADSPLRGEVLGSLECVELITVLEATFGIDVDGVLGPQALASAATLAKLVAEQARTGRLDWHQQPPTATALHASDVLSRVRTLPPGSVAARVDARTLVVGTPKTTTEPAQPPRADMDTSSGSLLAVGSSADAVRSFVDRLFALAAKWNAELVWYPLLRVPGDDDHPQQVMSGHTDGVLPHAACLELLRVTDLSYDRVLAGVGCAHRLEPGRRLDPRGRLESYRVFEAVVCGSESFCQDMWRRLERDVDDCLGEILPGGWQVGRDSFHPSMDRKLEWVVDLDDSGSLAVASLNDHHQAFTRQASTQSFCLGIGIDRIAIVAGEDFTYMLTH